MYSKFKIIILSIIVAAFAALTAFVLLPFIKYMKFAAYAAVSGLSFLVLSFAYVMVRNITDKQLYKKYVLSGFNKRLYDFCEKIRVSFSINDLTAAIQEILEDEADFAVLWFDSKNGNKIYNSPARKTGDAVFIKDLLSHYKGYKEGMYFLDSGNTVCKKMSRAEGVLISGKDYLLFFYSHYLPVFDRNLFDEVHREFLNYLTRVETTEKMFSLSAISKEWSLLAETQKSFLPESVPELPGLDTSLYYEALVNVSGDYYFLTPVDENRSLIVTGDVSGKGLSAALIMGIIINTIKIVENKADILKILKLIDTAIKDMEFDGKFTAIFIGLYDRSSKELSYINAGMPEPWLVSDFVIKILSSNCPLVGIIDLGEVVVQKAEVKTGDILIIATDGLTEIENEEGLQLMDSPDYKEVILNHTNFDSQGIVDAIIGMSKNYSEQGKLRDDISLIVSKAGE